VRSDESGRISCGSRLLVSSTADSTAATAAAAAESVDYSARMKKLCGTPRL